MFAENSIDQATAEDAYSAKQEIRQNMDDFKARLAKFGYDAKAARVSVKDLDSFKAAFAKIGKNDCCGCHDKYRPSRAADTGLLLPHRCGTPTLRHRPCRPA